MLSLLLASDLQRPCPEVLALWSCLLPRAFKHRCTNPFFLEENNNIMYTPFSTTLCSLSNLCLKTCRISLCGGAVIACLVLWHRNEFQMSSPAVGPRCCTPAATCPNFPAHVLLFLTCKLQLHLGKNPTARQNNLPLESSSIT